MCRCLILAGAPNIHNNNMKHIRQEEQQNNIYFKSFCKLRFSLISINFGLVNYQWWVALSEVERERERWGRMCISYVWCTLNLYVCSIDIEFFFIFFFGAYLVDGSFSFHSRCFWLSLTQHSYRIPVRHYSNLFFRFFPNLKKKIPQKIRSIFAKKTEMWFVRSKIFVLYAV